MPIRRIVIETDEDLYQLDLTKLLEQQMDQVDHNESRITVGDKRKFSELIDKISHPKLIGKSSRWIIGWKKVNNQQSKTERATEFNLANFCDVKAGTTLKKKIYPPEKEKEFDGDGCGLNVYIAYFRFPFNKDSSSSNKNTNFGRPKKQVEEFVAGFRVLNDKTIVLFFCKRENSPNGITFPANAGWKKWHSDYLVCFPKEFVGGISTVKIVGHKNFSTETREEMLAVSLGLCMSNVTFKTFTERPNCKKRIVANLPKDMSHLIPYNTDDSNLKQLYCSKSKKNPIMRFIYDDKNESFIKQFDPDMLKPEVQSKLFLKRITTDNLVQAISNMDVYVAQLLQKWKEEEGQSDVLSRIREHIATKFYSHLGWQLDPPLELIGAYHRAEQTVDIDQVVLMIKHFAYPDEVSFGLSNYEYMQRVEKEIDEKIFEKPKQSIRNVSYHLEYKRLALQMLQGHGGNTYMVSRQRKSYVFVPVITYGDVLKVSIELTKTNDQTSNKKGAFDDKFFEDSGYQLIQDYLLGRWKRGGSSVSSKIVWDELKPRQKLTLAFFMTCYYLAKSQGSLSLELLTKFLQEESFSYANIPHGQKIAFLLPFQLDALERVLGNGRSVFNVCYETYSNKQYVTVNTNEIKELAERNRDYSSGYIIKFGKMFSNRDACLIVGFGVSMKATTLENKATYPVIHLSEKVLCKYSSDSSFRTNEILEDEEGEEDEEEEEDEDEIERVDIEQLDDTHINHKMNEEIECFRRNAVEPSGGKKTKLQVMRYNVLGRTLPSCCQPATYTIKGTHNRYQHYSVSLRTASGEYPHKPKRSDISGDLRYYILEDGEGFNVPHWQSNSDKLFKSYYKTLDDLERFGNRARLERAKELNLSEDLDLQLVAGAQETVRLVEDCLMVYDVNSVVKIAKFFGDALWSTNRILAAKFNSAFDKPTYSDFRVIGQNCGYMKNLYSGKRGLSDRLIIGKRLGETHNRPILLPTIGLEANAALKPVLDDVWRFFCKDLDLPPISPAFKEGISLCDIPTKKFCLNCERLFTYPTQSMSEILMHPCKVERVQQRCILDTFEKKFQDITEKMLARLTEEQAEFVKIAKAGRNYCLTGAAGTGKSTTLLALYCSLICGDKGYSYRAVVGPTKSSACALYGETIHQLFCLPVDDDIDSDCYDFNNIDTQTFRSNYKKRCKMLEEKKKRELFRTIRNLVTLFIDECSLLSDLGLENLDFMLRYITDKSNDPFGGVQIILCGDVLQLEPIKKKSKTGDRVYFFESECFWGDFHDFGFQVFYLHDIHRQTDDTFISLLNKIRTNEITEEEICYINKTWGKKTPYVVARSLGMAIQRLNKREFTDVQEKINFETFRKQGSNYASNFERKIHKNFIYKRDHLWLRERYEPNFFEFTFQKHIEKLEGSAPDKVVDVNKVFVICKENVELDNVSEALSQLATNNKQLFMHTFHSVDTMVKGDDSSIEEEKYQNLKEECDAVTRYPRCFDAYVGKIVKFVDNRINPYVYNNMTGEVIKISQEDDEEVIHVIPQYLDKSLIRKVVKVRRLETCCRFKSGDCTVKFTRCQFPLKSAYAGNCFIVQGMTFSDGALIIVNLMRMTDNGQVYTACSRPTDSDHVFFLVPLTKHDIKVNQTALNFDQYHRAQKNPSKPLQHYN